jgi:hypothetical protein
MHSPIRASRAMLAACLLACLPSWAGAALPDGPYVVRGQAGWEAVAIDAAGQVSRRPVAPQGPDRTVEIRAVGTAPAFHVEVREPAAPASDTVAARGAPLFVVADTHCEFDLLVSMLRAHRVIDTDLSWAFGRGHLVVLGDVFDRGPNHLEILWLLYGLEAQAAKAGGGVHLLLGNHEAMVMRGDLRYLNAKYVESARVLGRASYSELFAADTLLGQWLRSRPAMLRVDRFLCLHAGVSRALVDSRLTIADVNAAVRSVLNDEPGQGAVAELVMGSFGPLWYRGYFPERSGVLTATPEDVDLSLETFGARRILVGHTIVPTVTPLYGGKVIAVQVYPKRDESGRGHFEALSIRKGEPWQALLDGSLRKLTKPKQQAPREHPE